MVTADGRLVHASADEEPELFWGLRGGGGNFGIVTSFEYDLHPVGPMILGGPIFHPGSDARAVIEFVREWSRTIPEEMTVLVNLLTAPPAPFLPEEVHGTPIVGVLAAYPGSPEEGEPHVRALREFGTPIADLLGPVPYVALQSLVDALYPKGGASNYFKSGYLRGIEDGAVDAILAAYESISSPMTEIHLQNLGGAIARVPEDATAFGERGAPWVMNLVTRWPVGEDGDPHVAWARGLYDAVEPHLTGGVYVNFLSEEGEQRTRDAYGPEKYARLVALKDRWDPDNVFHLNQNIAP
jgi:FAD/FMN-containing dehydrogenase